MAHFMLLNPTEPIMKHEIEKGIYGYINEEKEQEFLERLASEGDRIREDAKTEVYEEYIQIYSLALNSCIHQRYRSKGYRIVFAIEEEEKISEMIAMQQSDILMRYHCNEKLLFSLGTIDELKIGGFHLWSCVESLAQKCCLKGIDTLVDEDLTELFNGCLRDASFRYDKYPSRDIWQYGPSGARDIIEARKGKPWLWQY